MKLRNKKTGQLGNFIINKDHFECVDLDYVPEYRNLAELNEEWEDYEEPTEYCYITSRGNFHFIEDIDDEGDKERKEIGNYFETREEAEKAVEKLKAWKRLKDKGFRFKDWELKNGHKIFFGLDDKSFNAGWLDEKIAKDLDLLFGGEE